jgi:hypothetical protein
VLAAECAKNGQGNGVVTAQGNDARVVGQQAVVVTLDDRDRLTQVVGVECDIPGVGNLKRVERRRSRGHTVGSDQNRFAADLAWAVARAHPVTGADVQWHANDRDVQIDGRFNNRLAEHAGDAREPRQLIAANWLIKAVTHNRIHATSWFPSFVRRWGYLSWVAPSG